MKSLKLVLITAIISFSLVTMANTLNTNLPGTKTNQSKRGINMTFEQAIQNHSLVREIHKQVHLNTQIGSSCPHSITVNVSFRNRHVKITGTYEQWIWFFRVRPEKKSTQIKHRDK